MRKHETRTISQTLVKLNQPTDHDLLTLKGVIPAKVVDALGAGIHN